MISNNILIAGLKQDKMAPLVDFGDVIKMYLHYLDILVLLAYLVGMALMGIYFSRNNNSTEDYFVGSRSFQGWVIGLSLVGTSISSITFLAYPADAFKTAWLRFIPNHFFDMAK